MQTTLTFTKDGKKYVSKPFDFKTACIINDKHSQNMCAELPDRMGVLSMCYEAVTEMFNGTEVTQDIMDSLSIKTKSSLCCKLFDIYIAECFPKNE